MQVLECGRFSLLLNRPKVMAVVNVTPDSFSGDGVGLNLDAALRRADEAMREGADILDLGGESSRPGAESVGLQEELDRVLPLVERLAGCPVPISLDTVKPGVMRAAIDAGASLVNDINAFREPGAIEVIAGSSVGVCIMHMRGEPRTMQEAPHYEDVVAEVQGFLDERIKALMSVGLEAARIMIDPGFGFGKTLEHNLALFRALGKFVGSGHPVLAGLSRKSMLGAITGRPAPERVSASVAAALLAVQRGVQIVRVHDVAATRDAIAVWEAIKGEGADA